MIIDSGPTPGGSEPVEAGKGPKAKEARGKINHLRNVP